jgi:putative spermidine/putrescine transport system substrate-binding protein/spermidine/putrescine transport system substrate-binding protein
VSRRQFLVGAGRAAGLIVASSTLGPLLTACGPGGEGASSLSLDNIQNATGTVKVLVWEGYENPDAFGPLDNIDIQAAYLAANEDTITKTEPKGAFDLVTIYQGMVDPLLAVDRIQPIDTSLLPNFDNLYPFFRETDAIRRDGNLYGVPYTWGTMMVLYDASQMGAPQSFRDLMDPALQGRIGMPDDAYATITTFARYAGFEDANNLTRAQLDEVMALLREFKPQLLSIAPNYGELPAMYQRGEIVASVPDWPPTAVSAQDAGVQVESTIVQEGAFSFLDSWMLVTDAENPAGAYAVMNQAISTEAQAVMGNNTWLGVVNPDAVADIGDNLAEAWRYEQIDDTFARAPLYPGAPVESSGDVTTLQDWLAAWEEFKAL